LPEILFFFSFCGGVFCTLLSITIPFACYYKVNGKYKYLALFVNIVFTSFGFAAAYITLYEYALKWKFFKFY